MLRLDLSSASIVLMNAELLAMRNSSCDSKALAWGLVTVHKSEIVAGCASLSLRCKMMITTLAPVSCVRAVPVICQAHWRGCAFGWAKVLTKSLR